MGRQKQVARKRNSCIVIKCEGDTEKVYFNNCSSREMPIHFATGNCKDPKGMLEDLCTYLDNEDYSAKDYGDRIYLVVDTDLDEKRINEIEAIRSECEKEGINIITSAPTFEVWFLMHFDSVGVYNSSQAVKRALTKFIPKYKEGQDVFDKLEDLEKAIARAKQQEQYAENNGEKLIEHNPHTMAYIVINNKD